MITVIAYHDRAEDLIGLIPYMLDEADQRKAADQFNERYAHGGGWQALPGWTLDSDCIRYPGGETLAPVAELQLRDETIFIYRHAWVCIVQPDGSFEVARMD